MIFILSAQEQHFPIKQFQQKILSWFAKNKRDLPWRETRDPYNILVSEIMSQQTQLARVIPKYEQWIAALPTVSSLAKATTREVLTLWSGLGYNRRAVYLQKAAQIIAEDYNEKFPQDERELQKLPGIGKYTAWAILCFAYNKQIAVVDTNVRKVIMTQFHISNEKKIQEIADQLLPKGKAYEWNQALMDYSSEMLRKEKIPIPKQSKFRDSDRYYRGQIIKLLIKQNNATFQEIYDYFTSLQTTIEKKRLNNILRTLEKDLLITQNLMSKSYQLP